ncbi:MAG: DUF1552 domain-containing protein, partial [Planctomycetes bacterium]|nr:DUF1552 domain-containing protein [Planctomycetota bacterium]
MSQKTTLPRRTFLKGLGTAMGVPFLEAMISQPLFAAPVSQAMPTRMAFVFFPNGAIMPDWKPSGEGTGYTLSKTLKPLEKLKGDFNVFSGLAQDNGRAKGDGPGDHARCASTYLTGAHPYKTSGANIKVGVSVDQAAAALIGKKTKLPSLEIGIDRGRNAGNCDSGYSCAYSSNVSWKSATTPMAKEINPRLVFERLFGSGADGGKSRAKRDLYRKSILDLVAGDAAALKKRLGTTDRRKIEEYFASVREIEQRIIRAEKLAKQRRPNFNVPSGVPRDMSEHIRLMYDLLLLAFRTDTTRVATFMLGNAGSNRNYRMVGVNSGWHSLSHHRNKSDKMKQLQRIDEFHVKQFAAFLTKMKAVKEGDRTLLDNSMIVYGSGLSDANRHWHHDLPIVMAGRGGNTIKTGRHLKFDSETPLNDLFLSMLDRVGARVKS